MKTLRVVLLGLAVVSSSAAVTRAAERCSVRSIACGQVVSGSMGDPGCGTASGLPVDYWQFSGAGGQHVIVELSSAEFDPAARLFDSDGRWRATDDDSGTGLDARMDLVLDKTGSWTIAAAPAGGSNLGGAYSLTLRCGALQAACVQDGTSACLLSGRFRATARYRGAFDNAPADTTAFRKPVSGFANPNFETVFFYFNSADNIEILLKMLDQGNVNGLGQATIAVLFGSATPLRVELTITDTLTGASKTYTSEFNTQRGATDFTAFVK